MSERIECAQCRQSADKLKISSHWYQLKWRGVLYHFCSKAHIQDWLKQGRDGVTVCQPYKPTPDEEERMSQ